MNSKKMSSKKLQSKKMSSKKIMSKKLFSKRIPSKKLLFIFTIILCSTLILATITVINSDDSSKSRIIDPEQEKEVTIQKDEIIKINQDVYNIKEGSKFVFNKKGEIAEGTKYTTKDDFYNINGFDVILPEDSIVTYVKEDEIEKVVVELKDGSIIDIRAEGEEDEKGLIEFRSDGEIELKNGLKIQGLSTDTAREQTNIFYDGDKNLFYIKEAEIRGKEIGRLNSDKPNSYLFFDEIPDNFDKPAILIKENEKGEDVFILKGTATEESPDLSYKKEGAKIIAQAYTNGEVELTFGEKRVEMIAKGDYSLVNGELFETNGKIKSITEKGKKLFNPTEEIMPLHLKTFKKDGTPRAGESFYNIGGQDFFVGIPGENGVYTKADGSFYVEKENLKTIFNSITKEQREKYNALGNREKLAVFTELAKGNNLGSILNSILDSFQGKVDLRTGGKSFESNALSYMRGELERDAARNPRKLRYNQAILIHEASHKVNADLTNQLRLGAYYEPSEKNSAAFYFWGENKYIIMPTSGLRKDSIGKLIPMGSVNSYIHNNYFNSNNFGKRDGLHLIEDYVAELNGFESDSPKLLRDMFIYSGALGMQMQNTGVPPKRMEQYNAGYKYITERAATKQIDLSKFRTSTDPKAVNIRTYLQKTYGSSWTQKHLGF